MGILNFDNLEALNMVPRTSVIHKKGSKVLSGVLLTARKTVILSLEIAILGPGWQPQSESIIWPDHSQKYNPIIEYNLRLYCKIVVISNNTNSIRKHANLWCFEPIRMSLPSLLLPQ